MTISIQFIIQLVQFIAGLAILIFIHELGHFLAARLLKVEVEEFGFGFPPRILTLFQAGGTNFTLNWIPLGGFVRLKGENDPEVPGGLAAANPWTRLAVLFAGPVMNITLGIILSVILFYNLGEPDRVQIASISSGSPAEAAGLQAEDIILSVNGEQVYSSDELHNAIYANLGNSIRLGYQRNDQTSQVSLVPRDPPPADGAIGIEMVQLIKPTTLARAIPAGLRVVYEYGRSVVMLPVRVFQGQATPEESRPIGYKGMFDIYQQLQSPLTFFMVLTMSLGIFNLFPIPALDGGRILFTLPEILFRKRIPAKYENLVHLVGFALLILLLIYVNVQDFVNPIQLPR